MHHARKISKNDSGYFRESCAKERANVKVYFEIERGGPVSLAKSCKNESWLTTQYNTWIRYVQFFYWKWRLHYPRMGWTIRKTYRYWFYTVLLWFTHLPAVDEYHFDLPKWWASFESVTSLLICLFFMMFPSSKAADSSHRLTLEIAKLWRSHWEGAAHSHSAKSTEAWNSLRFLKLVPGHCRPLAYSHTHTHTLQVQFCPGWAEPWSPHCILRHGREHRCVRWVVLRFTWPVLFENVWRRMGLIQINPQLPRVVGRPVFF